MVQRTWNTRCFVVLAMVASIGTVQARDAGPDVKAVQTAYDAARDPGGTAEQRHETELSILRSQCQPLAGKAATHVCQVDFVRKSAPQGRLYFDVITVAEEGRSWVLLSGLCRTKPVPRTAGS